MRTTANLLFMCLVLLTSISAQDGEMDTRKYFVGGSLGFSSGSNTDAPLFSENSNIPIFISPDDESKYTSLSVAPYIGRQLNENWSLGIQVQYGLRDRSSLRSFPGQPALVLYETEVQVLSAGLFSRYTFFNRSDFNIFCQPFFDYRYISTQNFRDGLLDGELKTNMIEAGVDLGATYQFSPSFRALIRVGGLSYSSGNTAQVDTDFQEDFNSFNARFSLRNIGLGVEYWW